MAAPQRIQLRRTPGWRMPAGAVKVDRSTTWGNPYVVSPAGCDCRSAGACSHRSQLCRTPEIAVARFRAWLGLWTPEALAEIASELRGKDLACWCAPGAPCHADVLLELANAPESGA